MDGVHSENLAVDCMVGFNFGRVKEILLEQVSGVKLNLVLHRLSGLSAKKPPQGVSSM